MTTALSPESTTSMAMIWATASQKTGEVRSSSMGPDCTVAGPWPGISRTGGVCD